jgi:periplasmic protein CpxP/Spy
MTVNFTHTLKQRITSVKLVRLFAGALSLTIAAGTITPVFAQSPSTPQTEQGRKQREGIWAKLNLTADQKAQLKSIREANKAKVANILTAEQKQQLQAAKGNRQNRREVWKSLNLTADQKAQMQQVRQEAKQQMESVLTPEQLQQLQQFKQQRRDRKANPTEM